MTREPLRCGWGKLNLMVFCAAERGLDFLHPLDLLQLALRLRGLAGLGAKAIRELLKRGDFLLLILIGGKLLLFARNLFHEIFIVVSAVAVQAGVRDFHDGIHELIQELPIMGDHEDRAGIVAEIFLKPDERFEIEMIGRFVEQQKIRLLHEQPREVRAHHPAAAQRPGLAIEIRFAKCQPVEDLLRLGFELPAAEFIEGSERVVVFIVILGLGRLVALDDALGIRQLG